MRTDRALESGSTRAPFLTAAAEPNGRSEVLAKVTTAKVEVFESFDSRAIVVWIVDFESDPEDSATVARALRTGIGAGVDGMDEDLRS